LQCRSIGSIDGVVRFTGYRVVEVLLIRERSKKAALGYMIALFIAL
jgi:hypothetical protein